MNITVKSLPPFQVVEISESARKYEDVMDIKGKIESMTESGTLHVAINLSRVDYMHSFFIKILTTTYKKLKAAGGELVLIGPNEFIKELIHLLNIDEYIRVFSSEENFKDTLKAS
jgi:anti-anti-sigma factor